MSFDVSYLSLEDDPALETGRSREEITAGVVAGVLPPLSLRAQTRRNLEEDAGIWHKFGFVYRHPCLKLVAGVERENTQTGGRRREHDLLDPGESSRTSASCRPRAAGWGRSEPGDAGCMLLVRLSTIGWLAAAALLLALRPAWPADEQRIAAVVNDEVVSVRDLTSACGW